jgi:hypothetical protein
MFMLVRVQAVTNASAGAASEHAGKNAWTSGGSAMKQVAIRLSDDVYKEFAKRAGRERRKVTPYLQQFLTEAAKTPAPAECIVVDAPDDLRWAVTSVAKELGLTPAAVLIMAADMVLDELIDRAMVARARRKEGTNKIDSTESGPAPKTKKP